MITSFTVSNFRSFANEQTLNLIASKRFTSHENHAVSIPGSNEKALRTGVIYGANGAGKSNLFKTLWYVKKMALNPRDKNSGTGREFFQFGLPIDQSSDFELRFIARDNLYEFGFKADEYRIKEEWLTRIEGNKEKTLYERITDDQGKVTIDTPHLKDNEKISALATVGGPQNQTFLATLRATLGQDDYGTDISAVFNWFETKLRLIRPTATFRNVGAIVDEDPQYLEFASAFLRASSTGISTLAYQKREVSEEDIRAILPEPTAERVLTRRIGGSAINYRISEDTEVRVERTDKDHYYLISIAAEHAHKSGHPVSLEISEESDGTRRLLQLIPVLHHLREKGGVFFIDEIDRSLHPLLVWKFLEYFLKSCGDHSQVLVTTHESNLLDLDLLRRDEIWFAEKDVDGSSRLYSLSDFNVRKDLEIRKHYLQGRFGAIPFLGNLDRLLSEESSK